MIKILTIAKKTALLSLVLAIGYVIGSIHAPFEVKWRSGYGDGLPDVSGYSMEDRLAMDNLIDDNLEIK